MTVFSLRLTRVQISHSRTAVWVPAMMACRLSCSHAHRHPAIKRHPAGVSRQSFSLMSVGKGNAARGNTSSLWPHLHCMPKAEGLRLTIV